MTHTLVGRGRRSVRHEEAVLDIVHGNPSTSTYRHISSATGRLSQRAVWRSVREKKLNRFMYNQCTICGREQTFSCRIFSMSATKDCVHPSVSVTWRGMKEKVYATEVRVCDDVINRIQVTAADIVPGQMFFVRGSI